MSMYYLIVVDGTNSSGPNVWVTDKYELVTARDRSNRYPYEILGNFISYDKLTRDSDRFDTAKTFCESLEVADKFLVKPLMSHSALVSQYNEARVYREMYLAADKLKGFTESFVNEHFSPELKEILKKAPAAAETARDLLFKGIEAAVQSLKK